MLFTKRFAVFLLIFFPLHARITTLHHLRDLLPLLTDLRTSNSSKKILVAFDLCNTLIIPNNQNGWGSDHWLDAHAKRLIEKEGIEPAKAWAALLPIYYEIQKHSHFMVRLVEPETLTVFRAITQLADVTIGLTARSLPIIGDTFRLLSDVGICFKASSQALQVQKELTYACYVSGIIFCGSINKGLALNELFDVAGYKPDVVLFVDDKFKNVQAVDRALSERGIDSICVQYIHLKDTIEHLQLHHVWGCLDGDGACRIE